MIIKTIQDGGKNISSLDIYRNNIMRSNNYLISGGDMTSSPEQIAAASKEALKGVENIDKAKMSKQEKLSLAAAKALATKTQNPEYAKKMKTKMEKAQTALAKSSGTSGCKNFIAIGKFDNDWKKYKKCIIDYQNHTSQNSINIINMAKGKFSKKWRKLQVLLLKNLRH